MSEKKEDLSILLNKAKERIYNLKKHGNAFVVDWSFVEIVEEIISHLDQEKQQTNHLQSRKDLPLLYYFPLFVVTGLKDFYKVTISSLLLCRERKIFHESTRSYKEQQTFGQGNRRPILA